MKWKICSVCWTNIPFQQGPDDSFTSLFGPVAEYHPLRQEIVIETLELFDRSDRTGQISEFYAQLRFYDNSVLQVVEKLTTERYMIIKSRYAYHYQQANGEMIFRYDNARIILKSKHTLTTSTVATWSLLLCRQIYSEVLREIDTYLYPQSA